MNTPPLLIGMALLFWGWQAGFLAGSLAMALVLEGSRLIRHRWPLSQKDFYRLADFCAVLFLCTAVYQFISGTDSAALWLPFTIFFLLTGQAYSTTAGVDMGAIFYTARKREKSAVDGPRSTVDISYPCLVLIVLAASAANVRTPVFYLGSALLAGWALWPLRPRRARFLFLPLLMLAAVLGYGGGTGLNHLQVWLEDDLFQWLADRPFQRNPFRNHTAMGEIGRLKQYDRIVMRVKPMGPFKDARLLHEASFNRYNGSMWVAGHARFEPIAPPAVNDSNRWVLGPEPELPPYSAEITKPLKNGTGILGLPHGTFRLEGLEAMQLERNAYGAFRVHAETDWVRYRVVYHPSAGTQSGPGEADLSVPESELPALRSFMEKMPLAGLSQNAIAGRIKTRFQANFAYSLDQSAVQGNRTALSHFLLVSKTGHCEFFATATVLLLRQAGIPARYATGYVASEYSRLENCIVVRARHAHAWAIAYMDGGWQPVDSTPSSWQAIEEQRSGVLAPLLDVFRWVGFHFTLWQEKLDIGAVPWYWRWGAVPLLAVFLIRLVRKRHAVVNDNDRPVKQRAGTSGNPFESPYHALQASLARHGYPRHPWEPAGEWVTRLAQTDLDENITADLREMVDQHYRLRFHPKGLTLDKKAKMEQTCQRLLKKID